MTGEKTASERSVRYDGDAQLVGGPEEVDLGVFNIEGEGRVFDLNRGDRMHSVGSTEGCSRALGQPQIPDLSLSKAHVSKIFIVNA